MSAPPENKFPAMHKFSRRLLKEWRDLKLPISGVAVIVAVSGGADSTALLLSFEELVKRRKLNVEILVAHLDHGLRESSKQDSKFVSGLARDLGLPSTKKRVDIRQLSQSGRLSNIEEVAREARYEFLEETARRRRVKYVLTGHTMDDQAETVLLRLMRGSSSAGLSAMERIRPITENSSTLLVRPLLWAQRNQTEEYCQTRNTKFLVDEMNLDESLARVRVRQKLIPLMRTFNNRIIETLARTADLMREDAAVLANEGNSLLERAIVNGNSTSNRASSSVGLDVSLLENAQPSARRQAIRKWLSEARGDTRRLEMVHILAVEGLLMGKAGGRTVELPKGGRVARIRGKLEFKTEND